MLGSQEILMSAPASGQLTRVKSCVINFTTKLKTSGFTNFFLVWKFGWRFYELV